MDDLRPEQGAFEAPTTDLAERERVAQIEAAAPRALQRWAHAHEEPYQHAAFLWWVLQSTEGRSHRSVARLVDRGPTTVRQWMDKYKWHERATHPEAALWATRLMGACYPGAPVRAMADAAREALAKVQGYSASTRVTTGVRVPASEDVPANAIADTRPPVDQARAQAKSKADRTLQEFDLLKAMLRGAFGVLADQIKDKKAHVSIRDLPALTKTWLLLNGSPTEVVELRGALEQAMPSLPETTRVRLAKAGKGADDAAVLKAMRQDLHEVQAAIDQLLVEEDNVVPFPEAASG